MSDHPDWLENLLTWPTFDDGTPTFEHVDLERQVRARMRSDERFRSLLADLLADLLAGAELTVVVRRWMRHRENRLLPLRLEDV